MGYLEDLASDTGNVATATSKAGVYAVSVLFVPVLELALMAWLITKIVEAPKRLLRRGDE